MTNRNALLLCGLFTALSLQAGEAPRLQGPALTEAIGHIRQGRNPFASAASSISEAAPQGWGSYLWNKGGDALGSAGNALGSRGSYLWNKGGSALSSTGNAIRGAWDWSKGVPYAGVVPRGLGYFGSTAAQYATSPYIAQSIAQRLPRASFVKDYPGATNLAAALAAAGAGYTLYKGGQYAVDSYYGPLDSQILALMKQENNKDISKEALANIHNKLDPLLAQKAEQLLASSPDTDVYTKVEWLLNFMSRNKNSYPSKFVFNRLLYYIYNIAMGLLEKHQQALLAHIEREQKDIQARALPKHVNSAMQMLEPFYNEIADINTTITDLRNRSNKLPKPEEQAPGYFSGWFRGK